MTDERPNPIELPRDLMYCRESDNGQLEILPALQAMTIKNNVYWAETSLGGTEIILYRTNSSNISTDITYCPEIELLIRRVNRYLDLVPNLEEEHFEDLGTMAHSLHEELIYRFPDILQVVNGETPKSDLTAMQVAIMNIIACNELREKMEDRVYNSTEKNDFRINRIGMRENGQLPPIETITSHLTILSHLTIFSIKIKG